MNKYERIYKKACEKRGSASWLDSAVAALAVDLEEHTGKPVDVSGPFGLRAEVTLNVGGTYTTISPSFEKGELKLYYDTGEKSKRYKPQTLGDFNGFNNVQAALPDTFEEIVAIFTRKEEAQQ